MTSGSHGQAVAGTVGAPVGPHRAHAYSNNGQVTVTWGAATLGNNHPVLGYFVTRTNASNVTVAACGTSSAALTSSTSCTDGSGAPPANTTVPDGTYSYNITAAYHLWGTAASSAGSVIVETAPPTSTLTFPATAGPFKAPPGRPAATSHLQRDEHHLRHRSGRRVGRQRRPGEHPVDERHDERPVLGRLLL